jgi:hypothetical protein
MKPLTESDERRGMNKSIFQVELQTFVWLTYDVLSATVGMQYLVARGHRKQAACCIQFHQNPINLLRKFHSGPSEIVH